MFLNITVDIFAATVSVLLIALSGIYLCKLKVLDKATSKMISKMIE